MNKVILFMLLFFPCIAFAQGKITRTQNHNNTTNQSTTQNSGGKSNSSVQTSVPISLSPQKIEESKNVCINTTPSNANVYIDGTYIGLSPCRYNIVKNKNYSIKIDKQGYNSFYKNITFLDSEYNYVLEPTEIHVMINSAPQQNVSVYRDGKWVGYTPCEIVGKRGEVCTLVFNKGGYDPRQANYTFYDNESKTFEVPISPVIRTSSNGDKRKAYITIHGYNSNGKLYINGKYEGDLLAGNDGERIIEGDTGAKCKIEIQYFNSWNGKKHATKKITVRFGDIKRVFTSDSDIRAEK